MKTLSTMKEAWPVRREGGCPSTEEGWGRLCSTEKQGALTAGKDVGALAHTYSVRAAHMERQPTVIGLQHHGVLEK